MSCLQMNLTSLHRADIHINLLRPLLILTLLNCVACDGDGEGARVEGEGSGVDRGIYIPVALDMDPVTDTDLDLPDGVVNPEDGAYGAPCDVPEDCTSRLCVALGEGRVCTTACSVSCAPFADGQAAYCRYDPAQNTDNFLCYPSQNRLCQACLTEAQCDGAPCIETNEGPRCTQHCRDDADCPSEFQCQGGGCHPLNGSCDCGSVNADETRVCERSSPSGRCFGEERCDPERGWVGCDAEEPIEELCDGLDQNCNGIIDEGIQAMACQITNEFGSCEGVSVCLGGEGSECYGPSPAEERCDLIDNDCDGVIDEGFTLEDGRYGLDGHCGRCELSCEGQVPNATQTRCDASLELPSCVAETCALGFQLINGVACVPTEDVICEPCTDDASCSTRSPGAACVQIGDPLTPETLFQVCGRDCSADGAFGEQCPEGYSCQRLGEGPDALSQCLPQSGHCLCLSQPPGFSIPCQVESPLNPALSCQGRRVCDAGEFGDCTLPDELCDGIDNDCDGVIDNGFRSPEGAYNLNPEHCGRCQLSCEQLEYPNASASCALNDPQPKCEMICEPGFADLDNGSDDGCECELIPGDDLPDGLDQNCDGVDGDRSRGLFVSKTGDDQGTGALDDPLLTLTRALELASGPQAQVRDIYIATGVYSENITLTDGVSLYGGYSLDFRERDPAAHPTTLFGRPTSGEARGTLTAHEITAKTRVDGLSIYGANATVAGENSIAVLLLNSTSQLTLSDNDIIAGNGAPGQRGVAGTSGATGLDGQRGQDALNTGTSVCFNQETTGGSGGVMSCGGQSVKGGGGGRGHCPITQQDSGTIGCSYFAPESCRNSCDSSPCEPLPPPQGVGERGSGIGSADAEGGGPTYDRWSSEGLCTICGLFPNLPHLGNPGANGPNGAQGAAGQGCGDISGSLNARQVWSTTRGEVGGAGLHGTGGGGGSAGSGFDTTVFGPTCFDTIGGSGGGGGSGGCGGQPGLGGTGGGGSFAILIAYDAQGPSAGLPQLLGNRVTRGIGGQGGSGGTGGLGGFGGEGAVGGIAAEAFCAEPGGRGGNGGDGGHGGGGGGGCGGISVSIYVAGATGLPNSYETSNELLSSGRAGTGGQGGGSTGRPGLSGADGLLADVITVP